jgi:hypothetical protein
LTARAMAEVKLCSACAGLYHTSHIPPSVATLSIINPTPHDSAPDAALYVGFYSACATGNVAAINILETVFMVDDVTSRCRLGFNIMCRYGRYELIPWFAFRGYGYGAKMLVDLGTFEYGVRLAVDEGFVRVAVMLRVMALVIYLGALIGDISRRLAPIIALYEFGKGNLERTLKVPIALVH